MPHLGRFIHRQGSKKGKLIGHLNKQGHIIINHKNIESTTNKKLVWLFETGKPPTGGLYHKKFINNPDQFNNLETRYDHETRIRSLNQQQLDRIQQREKDILKPDKEKELENLHQLMQQQQLERKQT